ncbi:hypothetical protein LTR62_002339 [Meristemomyces frigidus]|uniref:Uncharacterized protein n=1 Tax=Meristemomyces frigidus TaxID=1508187 RepID=A0AAN7TAE3_9PEZI|nr:hypothetical protein LTR62_002339 [Meristemomyces frigidus]
MLQKPVFDAVEGFHGWQYHHSNPCAELKVYPQAVAKDRVSEVAQEAVTAPNLRLTQCYMHASTNDFGGYITLEVPLADALALARQVPTTVPDDKAVAKRTVVNNRVSYT